jgi:hypothetical protein
MFHLVTPLGSIIPPERLQSNRHHAPNIKQPGNILCLVIAGKRRSSNVEVAAHTLTGTEKIGKISAGAVGFLHYGTERRKRRALWQRLLKPWATTLRGREDQHRG